MLSRSDLHDYQNKVVSYIKEKGSCALWVEMGLGKTVSTLTALVDLFNDFAIGKVLIIAPLKVAINTWPHEIKNWKHTKDLKYSVCCGVGAPERVQRLNAKADIFIINRENIKWLVEHYGNQWPFDTVVIDESSSFKSHSTKRFKKLKTVRKLIDRVIELTGTPASNGYHDLWSQIFLLDQGERLGKGITKFRDMYFTKSFDGFAYNLNNDAAEKIDKKIDDICLSMQAEDYLQMPDKINNYITIDLEPKLRKQYKKLERDFIFELENGDITASNAAAKSSKMRQFCNGSIYDENKNVHQIHDLKLEALERVIEEANGNPVLIAYNFIFDAKAIQKQFKKAIILDKDPETINRWNNKEIPILLCHPQSAGHGLNLQNGGNILVWFGLNWALELYQQFNARLYRQGQKEKVFIHHLVIENSIDETILDRLGDKNITQKSLLDSLKADIKGRV